MRGRSKSMARCRPTETIHRFLATPTPPENVMRHALSAMLTTSALLSLDAHAIDLLQVYKEALVNDQVYAGARYTLEAGQEKTTQGRAGLLPTLGSSGTYTRSFQNSTAAGFPETTRDSKSNGYRIDLTQ